MSPSRGGPLRDSGYARQAASSAGSNGLVASPSYLDTHGVPESLADLARHHCIGFSPLVAMLQSGACGDLNGLEEEVRVQARRR